MIFNIRRATINHDILIQILKNGESYVVNDGVGEPQQVVRPPNKHMLAAAKLIEQLLGQLQHQHSVLMQMQHERDEMANALIHYQNAAKNGNTEV